MPTWKSPLSAASLPSRTRSCASPAASWSRTTAAISRATSAGPSAAGRPRRGSAAVQPTASAARSCSTASASPRVTHGGRAAGRGGDLHGQLDGALLVVAHREAGVAAVDGLGVLGEHDLAGGVGDPLDADEHVAGCAVAHQRIRSLVGVEERGRVDRADGHGVELLHVGHRELVADPACSGGR